YGDAAQLARAPSLQELDAVVRELGEKMRSDSERGDEPVLFLTYSGHGAQADDGPAFLAMSDGALTRDILYRKVLAALPARFVHLLIDACHAEAIVGSRGLFSKEANAHVEPLTGPERNGLIVASSL